MSILNPRNPKSSIVISQSAMSIIKNISKTMSDHVNIERKKEIHNKAEEVLKKIDKETVQQNKRESILDFDMNNLNIKKKVIKKSSKTLKSMKGLSQVNQLDNTFKEEDSNLTKKSSNKDNFYKKQQEHLSMHELKMNHYRKEKIEEERQQMKNKPQITKNTQKILNNKKKIRSQSLSTSIIGSDLPLYQRVKEIQQEKEERFDQLRKLYEMVEKTKEERLNPNKIVIKPYNPEKFEKWRQDKIKWIENKKAKLTEKKYEIENNKEFENNTFHPQTNIRSNMIIKEKYNNSNFLDRNNLYEEQKFMNQVQISKLAKPSFAPMLIRNLPNYIRQEEVDHYKINKSMSCEIIYYQQDNESEEEKDIMLNNSQLHSDKNKIGFILNKVHDDKSSEAIDSKVYNNNKKEASFENKTQTSKNKENTLYNQTNYNINIRDDTMLDSSKENKVILRNKAYNEIISKLAI